MGQSLGTNIASLNHLDRKKRWLVFLKWTLIVFVTTLIAPFFGFIGLAVLLAGLIIGRRVLSQHSGHFEIKLPRQPHREPNREAGQRDGRGAERSSAILSIEGTDCHIGLLHSER